MNDSLEPASRIATAPYLCASVGGQLVAFPVSAVRDVFTPQGVTPVAFAPPAVMGLLNLRGRIFTLVDARTRLKLPPREAGAPCMAVGILKRGESYALIVDEAREVVLLNEQDCEPHPPHLDPQWKAVSRGVYRLDGKLLLVLDVDRILEFERNLNVA